jgi:hypothetical protein
MKGLARERGVDWEGQLITLQIYDAKSHTTKFVPVIFGSQGREFIPEPPSDHVYCLDSEGSYQELCDGGQDRSARYRQT